MSSTLRELILTAAILALCLATYWYGFWRGFQAAQRRHDKGLYP